VTVEDPVELEISGINQLEINTKQGMTFQKALKAI
jgi:type IV pilus assembly protein PilB